MPDEGERLQKVMARAGVASRRACEAMILAGRVAVNGQVICELGTRVNLAEDRVSVDGQPLRQADTLMYYAVYKPVGYLSSSRDERGGRLVVNLVPSSPRVYAVGRLDLDSEGLMLLTNDGALTLRLTHPRYEQEKEYRVLVRGELTASEISALSQGVPLPGKARPARAEVITMPAGWSWRGEAIAEGWCWVGITLREGHKREIREMMAQLGRPVKRLVRVRLGSLALGDLRPGESRKLTLAEIGELRRLTGLAERPAERGQS